MRPIIGLEVHIQLATRSKMFSRAPNPAHPDFDAAAPNSLLDPTVLGLPGALPVANAAAVEMAMAVGMALGCTIAPLTRWDRKSYFYPDLPKGYQVSQYDLPLCSDGLVEVPIDGDTRRIAIIRAHLEEDAGKLLHEAPGEEGGAMGGGRAIDYSIADLNRAGTPLLEVVTAPDFESADRAVSFARMLRSICRFLGVSECIMQKGHMRFEPNINAQLTLADGRTVLTPIVEIKNLNSFKALRAAIEHELAEQPRRFLEEGLEMAPGRKTTRGWDDARAATVLQRQKEDAEDYRYFPDPDLPALAIGDDWRESVRAAIGELPPARSARYIREYRLAPQEADALLEEPQVCRFYERCIVELGALGVDHAAAGRLAANMLLQHAAKRANERGVRADELGISACQVAQVAALRHRDAIGSSAADQLFGLLCEPRHAGADAAEIAASHGLLILRDDAALASWCDAAIAAHAKAAADVRAGKTAAIGRLVGEVMKLSGGRADPAAARDTLLRRLAP